MLRSLHIKDFAIIDDLEIEFSPGFNIMTGETGAGKTIIVGAIRLVLGDRAEKDMIRHGRDKAMVTAIFDATNISGEIKKYLESSGITLEDELVINRIVSQEGKGKITINGIPVVASFLKEVCERLVDIVSQHEHQRLLDPSFHTQLVDAFGDLEKLSVEYRGTHSGWLATRALLNSTRERGRLAKEKYDFLKFQHDELKQADLKPCEDLALETERIRLKHSSLLKERTNALLGIVYEDEGSAIEKVDEAISITSAHIQMDPGLSKWQERLLSIRSELDDMATEVRGYIDELPSDPERLIGIDDRIYLIRSLMKKHGGSIESCLNRLSELSNELDMVDHYDAVIAKLEADFGEAASTRKISAKRLSEGRKKVAKELGTKIAKGLTDLGMGKTDFVVLVNDLSEGEWDETGPNRIEFMFSPNTGEPVRPLVRIASGGELSRVILAIKAVLASRMDATLCSIFDEVDAGIGGSTAEVVGRKLKSISYGRQIICITHLAQVAVFGDHHLRIEKSLKAGRTITQIDLLGDELRVEEIARMLGGKKITDTTLMHAAEMIDLAK